MNDQTGQKKERCVPCDECGGSGYDDLGICPECDGHGYIVEENDAQ